MFKTNATAIICGETYNVRYVKGPNKDGMCTVIVPFANGDWTEKMAITKENVWLDSKEIPVVAMN